MASPSSGIKTESLSPSPFTLTVNARSCVVAPKQEVLSSLSQFQKSPPTFETRVQTLYNAFPNCVFLAGDQIVNTVLSEKLLSHLKSKEPKKMALVRMDGDDTLVSVDPRLRGITIGIPWIFKKTNRYITLEDPLCRQERVDLLVKGNEVFSAEDAFFNLSVGASIFIQNKPLREIIATPSITFENGVHYLLSTHILTARSQAHSSAYDEEATQGAPIPYLYRYETPENFRRTFDIEGKGNLLSVFPTNGDDATRVKKSLKAVWSEFTDEKYPSHIDKPYALLAEGEEIAKKKRRIDSVDFFYFDNNGLYFELLPAVFSETKLQQLNKQNIHYYFIHTRPQPEGTFKHYLVALTQDGKLLTPFGTLFDPKKIPANCLKADPMKTVPFKNNAERLNTEVPEGYGTFIDDPKKFVEDVRRGKIDFYLPKK